MAKTLSIKSITAGDIERRHPRYLTCKTDKQYARLANDIYNMTHEKLSFMEDREIRNASISLALYCEDMRSDTHLFETFTHLYKKMFGYYVPFYYTSDGGEASAPLDAMRFMLWHSICAERNGRMVNATNDALGNIAVTLLKLWKERENELEPNEELANYIYAEETQQDVNQVKTVLVWLCQGSLLGRWFNNYDTANDGWELKKFFPTLDKDTLAYANECFSVFEKPTWPLSLDPRHIYAEMIRIDMDDPADPMAEAIEHIGYKPFGLYQVMSSDSRHVQLKDFLGEAISVDNSGFMGNVQKLAQQRTHIAGSFLSLNGQWQVNGPCLWLKPDRKLIDNYIEEEQLKHHALHDYAGQYDDFISRHNGQRLYFFRNVQKMMAWMKSDLGIDTSTLDIKSNAADQPQVVFFEDNGQFTMSPTAKCIKHPANPFYDHAYAMENVLMVVASNGSCSPGMTLYLMEHDLIPDAMFNDMRGREHGRLLAQDNLEFVARCMRRDIECDRVVRPRTDTLGTADGEPTFSLFEKGSYEDFINLIAKESFFNSKAGKEWELVSVDEVYTVVRDVDNNKDYSIHTRDLYEAHLNLKDNEIKIANVAPFVGKSNAPAASALLYNVVGCNEALKYLLRHFDKIMKNTAKR